ncbi:MAG: hypothetical protein K2O66_01700 [Bacteroidales bacterium]|nr:hypothetical protein [Bacteroidales bacterium]MDE7072064.1 hypothetical protein [Bacteroidales bacterium]
MLRFETEADIRRVVITDMGERTVRNLPVGMYVACFYTETACVRRMVSVVR